MKRKAAESRTESSERPPQPSPVRPKTPHGFLYEEATGKTIDYIRYADQSSDPHAFEIWFTDGTFLFIEPFPRVQFRVRYLKTVRVDR